MRPTPAEIIEGLQYSLRNDLQPELHSAWAERMAGSMLWALEHLKQRWLHEHELAVEENADLRTVLDSVAAAVGVDAALGQALGAPDLAVASIPVRPWPPASDLIAENDRLRSALDGVVEAFPEERDDAANELWRELLGYIARQTERDDRLINVTPG